MLVRLTLAVSRVGDASMEEYRAYLMGPEGYVMSRVDLICEDEETARERAQQLAQDRVVELWQGPRKIAEYHPRH